MWNQLLQTVSSLQWRATAVLLLGALAQINGRRLDALYITNSDPVGRISCDSNVTYGSYGNPPIYIYPVFDDSRKHTCEEIETDCSFVSLPWDQESRYLVWVQDAGVDDSIREMGASTWLAELESRFRERGKEVEPLEGNEQTQMLPIVRQQPIILYKTSTSALISIPEHIRLVIDSYLSRFMVPIALPKPFPQPHVPVSDAAKDRIASILEGVRFNPKISSIVSSLSAEQMLEDVRHLTGEDGLGILARYSFSAGARDAANWITSQMQHIRGAVCEQRSFVIGLSPNIICQFAGSTGTSSLVILSAHYDSKAPFGSTRAPGGNDDGSGVVLLLEIARAINIHKINFKSNVQLVFFSGEELGLLGSAAYAQQLRADDEDILLMINADMIAHRSPSEPAQLGLPAQGAPGTREVAYLVGNLSNIYSPDLKVGWTSTCCSDHESFHIQGFPATQLFERAGPLIDPMYHTSGDISNRTGYDMEQAVAIGRAALATLLEAAGFDVDADDT